MEFWKTVPNFPKYKVSSLGRIKSYWKSSAGRLLSLGPNSDGYIEVSLYSNTQRLVTYVHHLVAEAFIGPRPSKLEIMHLNEDKNVNEVSNLAYGTSAMNKAISIANGKYIGSNHSQAKLTEANVLEIRELCKTIPQIRLAELFNVSAASISLIRNRLTWTHI